MALKAAVVGSAVSPCHPSDGMCSPCTKSPSDCGTLIPGTASSYYCQYYGLGCDMMKVNRVDWGATGLVLSSLPTEVSLMTSMSELYLGGCQVLAGPILISWSTLSLIHFTLSGFVDVQGLPVLASPQEAGVRLLTGWLLPLWLLCALFLAYSVMAAYKLLAKHEGERSWSIVLWASSECVLDLSTAALMVAGAIIVTVYCAKSAAAMPPKPAYRVYDAVDQIPGRIFLPAKSYSQPTVDALVAAQQKQVTSGANGSSSSSSNGGSGSSSSSVLDDGQPPVQPGDAGRWILPDADGDFDDLAGLVGSVRDMAVLWAAYTLVQGIVLLLMIIRLLRAWSFQSKLGIITKTLIQAAPQLLHLLLVTQCRKDEDAASSARSITADVQADVVPELGLKMQRTVRRLKQLRLAAKRSNAATAAKTDMTVVTSYQQEDATASAMPTRTYTTEQLKYIREAACLLGSSYYSSSGGDSSGDNMLVLEVLGRHLDAATLQQLLAHMSVGSKVSDQLKASGPGMAAAAAAFSGDSSSTAGNTAGSAVAGRGVAEGAAPADIEELLSAHVEHMWGSDAAAASMEAAIVGADMRAAAAAAAAAMQLLHSLGVLVVRREYEEAAVGLEEVMGGSSSL